MNGGLILLIIALVIVAAICVVICCNPKGGDKQCVRSQKQSGGIKSMPTGGNISKLNISDEQLTAIMAALNELSQTYNYNDMNTAFVNPLKRPEALATLMSQYGDENVKTVFYELIANTVKASNAKEGFISVGGNGASYNAGQDVFVGDALYTNQILQGDYNKGDLIKQVNETGFMHDGNTALGARPGDDFQCAMDSHNKNQELLEGATNEYLQNDIMAEVNKNINNSTDSIPSQALYNRGAQTKGKIIDLPNGIIGVLPERFYSERAKNQNIYKAKVVVPIPGFDISEERIGEELNGVHFGQVLPKRNQPKQPTSGGASTNAWTPNPDPVEKETFVTSNAEFKNKAIASGIDAREKFAISSFEGTNGDKMYRLRM